MPKTLRNDPYLTRVDTDADDGNKAAVQHYEKQAGSDGASSNTVFTLTKTYVPGTNTLMVFLNGQKVELVSSATDETEYEETSSTSVTFGAALADDDVVEFMVIGNYFITDTNAFAAAGHRQGINGIDNAAFQAWQMYSGSATNIPTVTITRVCDRWYDYVAITSGSITAERIDSDLSPGPRYAHRVKSTATFTGNYNLNQVIEAVDIDKYLDKTITVSMWARSSTTGTFCVALRSGGLDRCYVHDCTITQANVWQRFTFTLAMLPSTDGTWRNGSYGMYFSISTGSSVGSATPDTWASGSHTKTANVDNLLTVNTSTFDLTAIQMEVAPEATPFETMKDGDNLERCHRFYQKGAIFDNISLGNVTSVSQGHRHFFSTYMRATPTLGTSFSSGAGAYIGSTMSSPGATQQFLTWSIVNSGTSAGGTVTWTADAQI